MEPEVLSSSLRGGTILPEDPRRSAVVSGREELRGARAAVVGAGVVGLCVALELRARGAQVTLIDEGVGAPNASAVAAGMIAPAFEAALEGGRFDLLRAGRDLWPTVAGGTVRLHRDGALTVALSGEEGELADVEAALRGEGALHERLTGAAARRLSPGLSPEVVGAVFSPEDWRVEAAPTLRLLAEAFARDGGLRWSASVDADGLGALRTDFDAVVLCAGWGSRRLAEVAPELEALSPIKGQLVRFPGAGPFDGPTVRMGDGYFTPGSAGVVAGASMEAGLEDRALSPEVQARLAADARVVFPRLTGAEPEGAAGVRAATPDGLPLVGRSSGGVWLATGFRRNGWLLAPLAARITADLLAGRDPGPWAAAMRPGRFG